MPVTLTLSPVSPRSLGLYGLSTAPYEDGLIPKFIPGAPAIPGARRVGGISSVNLAPLVQLLGRYPGSGVYPGPACYPGRGVTVLLSVRSVVAGNLTPAAHGVASLTPAAVAVATLTPAITPAGIYPGSAVYPGPAHYPGHGAFVRLVPEPVAA